MEQTPDAVFDQYTKLRDGHVTLGSISDALNAIHRISLEITNYNAAVELAKLYLQGEANQLDRNRDAGVEGCIGPDDDALAVAKDNIGYIAGYGSNELRQFWGDATNAVHPIFGGTGTTGAKAFAKAFVESQDTHGKSS